MSELRRLRASVPDPIPDSYTPTGDVLDTLLLQYRRRTGSDPNREQVKKRIFLVITDGAASESSCRPLRTCVYLSTLTIFYELADSPEEGIINAATFFQKNAFPADQVLDPPCIFTRRRVD
jgi:hypothetical protein